MTSNCNAQCTYQYVSSFAVLTMAQYFLNFAYFFITIKFGMPGRKTSSYQAIIIDKNMTKRGQCKSKQTQHLKYIPGIFNNASVCFPFTKLLYVWRNNTYWASIQYSNKCYDVITFNILYIRYKSQRPWKCLTFASYADKLTAARSKLWLYPVF